MTVLAVLVVASATLTAAPEPPTPAVSKILDLFTQLRAAGAAHQPVAFQLSDGEFNEYSRWALKSSPRPGFESMSAKIFRYNYVSTFTVVDFDAVERWKPGTIPFALKPILNGKKSVWIDFRFSVQNAKLTFSVEKAYFQDVRLPAFFVEKLIEILAARQKEHYDTTKPLALPFGLRELWTADHVIQGKN